MTDSRPSIADLRRGAGWRIAWTITSLVLLEIVACGLSALPVLLLWSILLRIIRANESLQMVTFSLAIIPSYIMFALVLLVISPLLTRLARWRTPSDAEMRIAEMGWPLLNWVRYIASNHLVRVLSGSLFRGSPLWTFHLRVAGAKLGKRVYINSLSLNDYNLLDFGDDVVIGAGVHLSGHTVEAGVVKTGGVRLGHGTTVGLCAIVEIGVETGSQCQIGALSFVPKRVKLDGNTVYAGIPAAPIHETFQRRELST